MTGSRGTTTLTTRIGRILRAHGEAERRRPRRRRHRAGAGRGARWISRRDVLRTAGDRRRGRRPRDGRRGPAHAADAARPGTAPRIAIVGAGLAGLRAAHWLDRVKGLPATVYEGSPRAGGRCHSLRGYFDGGIVVEHGGALINTDHNATRNLASNLGLSLDVVAGGSYQGWDDKYWIDGADYPYDDANDDWGDVYQAFKAALASAPTARPTTCTRRRASRSTG